MSVLFSPITLRGLTVPNRVWLSAMCQYSADDGVPTDWHLVHLGARAVGGFGLLLTEATAVTAAGRGSRRDTGLYTDAQVAGWRRVVGFAHGQGTLIGVQLGHAGRKSSARVPWEGSGSLPAAEGGWTAAAPSALPFGDLAVPRELTVDEIADIVRAFGEAAGRAVDAGFDVVEIHAGHGYLAHQFLSPLSNRRTDGYGGSFDHRVRFLREVVRAVRGRWPDDRPLLVRLSATDWVDGGWTPADTTVLAGLLATDGADLVDVSSGGLDPRQLITVGPGYQVPFAREVRSAGVPVGAVGLITDPRQAEAVVAGGSADVVLLARAALREPSWPLRAAHELGVPAGALPYPEQYLRGVWR
ncbi:NADH:flavin oxidoreductase/NADH oxidase [Nakamurella deserti]|uniref:NADH:flavin oxidoreductase/NADH oxidase n=1 Tax=Nakamurella deserti TaxID=2164074 RepID=UPI000DBE76AE|nr:NADH:flavin oxidoreductase/NADH oxidase [Nakamurella deserti]